MMVCVYSALRCPALHPQDVTPEATVGPAWTGLRLYAADVWDENGFSPMSLENSLAAVLAQLQGEGCLTQV